jgi:hypothetical protein
MIERSTLKVRTTFTEDLLATSSGKPEVHAEFQASRSADAQKMEEETATLPAEEVTEKASTVFHVDPKGLFVWDYQWRGHIKEVIGHMCELGQFEVLSKWTHKRACDGAIFVTPRRIYLMRDGEHLLKPDGTLQRPLRATTLQGDRVALARSEYCKAGTYCEFEVTLLESLDKKSAWYEINLDLIKQCLDFGIMKGTGQWRSGGYGRYTYEILEEHQAGPRGKSKRQIAEENKRPRKRTAAAAPAPAEAEVPAAMGG